MLINYIVWNVDPEIFSIGPLSIRYYGVLWALSFLLGYLLFEKFVKKEGLPEGYLDTLTIYMAVGTIAGARLGHCLFYEPAHYLANPLDILKIWEGGLASHGAAIGIILALYLFSRKTKRPTIYILDRIAITVALAGVLIRLGNLMNSEIYGIETNLPWGFIFKQDRQVVPMHPTQIYEALAYLVGFVVLLFIYNKANSKPKPGLLFGLFLIFIFATRFLIEFIKQPQVDFEKDMILNMGQWLSIPFVIVGVGFIVWSMLKRDNASEQKGYKRK
ncbi:MAG: prolipoprotein diacylglyceryl transferase [Bacteroidetes bacterium HGW-Bacteroidetes-15]|nr:MAG: prolipoprotein diacylglyceryl transferase [Bacteroidetes bacterium HGW-Bacteroidetes-15]